MFGAKAFLATIFVTAVSAGVDRIDLARFPSTVQVGSTQTVQWDVENVEPLTLLVVRQTVPGGWESVSTLFENQAYTLGSHHYKWHVPNEGYTSKAGKYAIYLEDATYANITNFFTFTK